MSDLKTAVTEILDRRFVVGTRVVNCLVHDGSLGDRPKDCPRCRTDLENQFDLAIRANEFLNQQIDDIRKAIVV